MTTPDVRRRPPGHSTDYAPRLEPGEKRKRKTVDYSYSGEPLFGEPPASVGEDELLQRLREGLK